MQPFNRAVPGKVPRMLLRHHETLRGSRFASKVPLLSQDLIAIELQDGDLLLLLCALGCDCTKFVKTLGDR